MIKTEVTFVIKKNLVRIVLFAATGVLCLLVSFFDSLFKGRYTIDHVSTKITLCLPFLLLLCVLYTIFSFWIRRNDAFTFGSDGVKVNLHVGYRLKHVQTCFPLGAFHFDIKDVRSKRYFVITDLNGKQVLKYDLNGALGLFDELPKAFLRVSPTWVQSIPINVRDIGKGPIKSVTDYYVEIDGNTFKKCSKAFVVDYNAGGGMQSAKFYYASGIQCGAYRCTHNQRGQVLTRVADICDPILSAWMYNNQEWRIDKKAVTDFLDVECKYDDKGDLIERITYSGECSTNESFTYNYDDKGVLRSFSSSDEYTFCENAYNEFGQPVLENKTDDGVNSSVASIYTDGLLTEQVFSIESELVDRTLYGYDENNRKISESHNDANNQMMERYTYEYDADGFLVKETCLYFDYDDRSKMTETTVKTYLRDHYGNCLEEVVFVNGKLTDVVLSSFDYYD